MTTEIYPTETSDNFTAYNFVSNGKKGIILKGIRYSETAFENVWNLGFGDIDHITGEINDSIISNNGDSEKVLATVARSCFQFTNHLPNAMIFAIGSTTARTRLYQMGINQYLNYILELFIIHGLLNDQWEAFEKNKNYNAFLIQRR